MNNGMILSFKLVLYCSQHLVLIAILYSGLLYVLFSFYFFNIWCQV
jgi:hypothetical protein